MLTTICFGFALFLSIIAISIYTKVWLKNDRSYGDGFLWFITSLVCTFWTILFHLLHK